MSDQSTGGGSASSSLMASAVEAATGAYEDVRVRATDAASRTASAARAEALSRAEGAKDGLVDQGERFVQSLRSAVEGGDDSIQAKVMAAAADSVQDLVGSLRGKSLEQLLADAGGFARRNPGAFVAAAALAGFAVARFARASAPAAQSFADIEGTGMGSSYGSPRPTGAGYAGSDAGSALSGADYDSGDGIGAETGTGGLGYGAGRPMGGVSTSSLSTHDLAGDDGFEDSGIESTSDLAGDSMVPGASEGTRS